MESEEAIMENENNSNLESESQIRDRDLQISDGLSDDSTLQETDTQDQSQTVTSQEEGDSNMPAIIEKFTSSSAETTEETSKNCGEHSDKYERMESAEATSALVSDERKEYIPDYEEFIGSDDSSKHDGNLQSNLSENVGHDHVSDKTQENQEFSNVRSQDESMELDNSKLDPVNSSHTSYSGHSNEEQHIDVDETTAFQSHHSKDRERELRNSIDLSETSEENSNFCNTMQDCVPGSGPSRKVQELPGLSEYLSDEDLLEESTNDIHTEKVAEENIFAGDKTVPDSALIGVSEDLDGSEIQDVADNDIVTEDSLKLTSLKVAVTQQSSPEPVIPNSWHEQASSSSTYVKDSSELWKRERSNDNILQSSEPVSIRTDICSQNSGKDVGKTAETLLYQQPVAHVEECMDVTTSEKIQSDTKPCESFMTGNTNNSHRINDVLSLDDHLQEVDKDVDDEDQTYDDQTYNDDRDDDQTYNDDHKPESPSNRINLNLVEGENASQETNSERFENASQEINSEHFENASQEINSECFENASQEINSEHFENASREINSECFVDKVLDNTKSETPSSNVIDYILSSVDSAPTRHTTPPAHQVQLQSCVETHTKDENYISEDFFEGVMEVTADGVGDSEVTADDVGDSEVTADGVGDSEVTADGLGDSVNVSSHVMQLQKFSDTDHKKNCISDSVEVDTEEMMDEVSVKDIDVTTSLEHQKQVNVSSEDKDSISEVVAENTTKKDYSVKLVDHTTSSEHFNTPVNSVAQDDSNSEEDVLEDSRDDDAAVDFHDHSTSSEQPKELSVSQDKNSILEKDILEDSREAHLEDVKSPDHSNSSEHPEQFDVCVDISQEKNIISERDVLEDITEDDGDALERLHHTTSFEHSKLREANVDTVALNAESVLEDSPAKAGDTVQLPDHHADTVALDADNVLEDSPANADDIVQLPDHHADTVALDADPHAATVALDADNVLEDNPANAGNTVHLPDHHVDTVAFDADPHAATIALDADSVLEDNPAKAGDTVQLPDHHADTVALDADTVAFDADKVLEKSPTKTGDTDQLPDHTTSFHHSKVINAHAATVALDADSILEDNLAKVGDTVQLPDHTTSFKHSKLIDTDSDTVALDADSALEDSPSRVGDTVQLPDHTTSFEHSKLIDADLDTVALDAVSALEDSPSRVGDTVQLPDHTTSFEHANQTDIPADLVAQDKTTISEDIVMEHITEMTLDIDSSFCSSKSSHTSSFEDNNDSSLHTSAHIEHILEDMDVDIKPPRLHPEDMDVEPPRPHPEIEAFDDKISSIDQTCVTNSTELPLDDVQLNATGSEHMETSSKSGIAPVANETNESIENTSEQQTEMKVETTVELIQKSKFIKKNSKERKVGVGSKSGVIARPAKTTNTEPPVTTTNTDFQEDSMKISGIEPLGSSSHVNEHIMDNEIQMKSDSATIENRKHVSRKQSKNETNETVGKKVKVGSFKNEVLESKADENGLDIKNPSISVLRHPLWESPEKNPVAASSGDIIQTESARSRLSKSKIQTCLVCQKICKCKYNIVRNGDVKHLCDDACFKQFRKTPSMFLKSIDTPRSARKSAKNPQSAFAGKDALALYLRELESRQNSSYKTCAVCQLLNLNTSEPFCNWKGLDFCGESCLGKFQANLNTSCSFCHAYIPIDMRATCCIKIGNDMRPFCKQRCYNEFKKKLRLCAFCQRDVAGVSGAFTAMVGTEGKFKEFCSQVCMKKLDNEPPDFKVIPAEKGSSKEEVITCSLCKKKGSLTYAVQFQNKGSKICSDICLSAFKFANKINTDSCDSCGATCTEEEAQSHFVHCEGQVKHFCSDNCVSLFRKANSKVVQCDWCGTKKLNFDMIEKQDAENKIHMFCSLNCLSLFRVNLQPKSGQVVTCDQCRKTEAAQYHLTMSDASVRNFCCYSCAMTFQSHYSAKHSSGSRPTSVVPSPQLQPQQPAPLVPDQQQQTTPLLTPAGRTRISTRQASRQQSTFPVISNVISLAMQHGDDQHVPTPPSLQSPPQAVQPQVPPPQQVTSSTTAPSTTIATGNTVPSADGKHQILIQAAPPKSGKNKSSQCRPLTQTKSTSCRPHSQTVETQTDEVAPKCIMIPIPVPIYIPMPTVMFTAPSPKLVPFPIPIPVPIFIPTTRKSANGISKAIQEIVERMPSDPLEAELLMMAEAVAADKRPGDSDTDSEADTVTEDFGGPAEEEVIAPAPKEEESLMMRKQDRQGEEDMIQMALRMAEEMSGPIEDLETSVEPVAVSNEALPNQTISTYESQLDDDYISSRPNQHRVAKRPGRGRLPTARVKRPRTERSYTEDDSMQSEPSAQQQSMEPPPDDNYRLKFTYGVNAWRHWIISKNAQIEKTRQMTGSYRLRTFTTDILKCTTDELNYTLCMFIKEVRKPNGEVYSPDSIYYLCLGIQQYLYENNRIDNIFTDSYFEKFTDCLNDILKTLQPKVNSQGQMLCRIEEEHLWESKQLGAHSPFILLNTLIYFHTKHFILKTAQEHMALSFAQILKHWKKGMPLKGQSAASGKNVSLRFYCLANGKKDGLAARKNKDGLPVYEVTENFDNPLRCPVKLYEFFLSKCPESIKNRNDIFYPVPNVPVYQIVQCGIQLSP